jgi:DNA primase
MDRFDAEFADTLMGKTAAGRDPARWRTPLIHHPHRTLTKKDVFNYYSQPSVREALFGQLRSGPAVVIQKFSGEPTLRRLVSPDEPIRITQDAGDVDDPKDFQYWIERRAVEFHPVLGEKTNHVFVDVDPKEGVSWDDTRRATRLVHDLMEDHPAVDGVELRYTGGDGFHVIGRLSKDVHVDDARRLARSIVAPLTAEDPRLKLDTAGPGQIRLDTSTLKQAGSLRGLYSLNLNTGLVCRPVEEEHLSDFGPEDATIRRVLGYVPKNARSLRP